MLSVSYIFVRRKEYDLLQISKLSASVFIGAFLFMFFSVLSISQSILVSESIVTLSYLFLIIIALFVFYIIVKQSPQSYFNYLTIVIVGIGIVEALQVVNYFASHNKQIRSNELLAALKHNYGNRNILAISIAMKFPFVFYLFFKKQKVFKILSLIVLIIIFSAVLLIGTRTAIYGTIILLAFLCVYLFFTKDSYKNFIVSQLIPVLVVVFVSVLLSLSLNKIHRNKLNTFNDLAFTKSKKALTYKKSVKDSGLKKAKVIDDSGRSLFWKASIEDIKTSPLLGIGIGNWKLRPKGELVETTSKKNYFYPKRVHNDFLQVFSEIGVFGFLLYIGLFIITFVFLVKMIVNNIKESKKDNAFIVVVLLSSLLIYFMDSFFNFPHERTPIQVFAFFILALILGFTSNKLKFKFTPVLIVFLTLNLIFLVVTYKVYRASKIHKTLYSDFVGKDFFKAKYSISYDKMLTTLPGFPELDAYGRSTAIMKSFYAFNSGNRDKAIEHLNEANKTTPYHSEPFGVKALLYYQDKDLKNKDSAFFYAKKAFEIQPSKRQNFEILRRVYTADKDTANVIKTLNTYTSVVPQDTDGWIKKAEHLYTYDKNYDNFLKIIDSAYAANPRDEKIIEYRKKKSRANKEDLLIKKNNIKKHYDLAIGYFNEKKYDLARKEFHKVLKLDANNMAVLVNLGIMERVTGNYEKSIGYLTKVINANYMKNGQPEYNRGLCYYKLENNKKALESLELSRLKGYKSAQKLIDVVSKKLL